MNSSHILITGSNGGIGFFILKYLLEKGHRNIICHARSSAESLDSILKEYGLDPKEHVVTAELTDENSIAAMRKEIESKGKVIAKLVNVAGSSTNAMSWKMSAADFRATLEDNLVSAFLCSKEFIPKMREISDGRIINFSSVTAFSGIAGASHYAAAKAGLIGLTKSMALELSNKKITVNAIALGYFSAGLIDSVPQNIQAEIKTKIPAGRFGNYDDVGSSVEFLLAATSSFITGQVLHLNGGQY